MAQAVVIKRIGKRYLVRCQNCGYMWFSTKGLPRMCPRNPNIPKRFVGKRTGCGCVLRYG